MTNVIHSRQREELIRYRRNPISKKAMAIMLLLLTKVTGMNAATTLATGGLDTQPHCPVESHTDKNPTQIDASYSFLCLIACCAAPAVLSVCLVRIYESYKKETLVDHLRSGDLEKIEKALDKKVFDPYEPGLMQMLLEGPGLDIAPATRHRIFEAIMSSRAESFGSDYIDTARAQCKIWEQTEIESYSDTKDGSREIKFKCNVFEYLYFVVSKKGNLNPWFKTLINIGAKIFDSPENIWAIISASLAGQKDMREEIHRQILTYLHLDMDLESSSLSLPMSNSDIRFYPMRGFYFFDFNRDYNEDKTIFLEAIKDTISTKLERDIKGGNIEDLTLTLQSKAWDFIEKIERNNVLEKAMLQSILQNQEDMFFALQYRHDIVEIPPISEIGYDDLADGDYYDMQRQSILSRVSYSELNETQKNNVKNFFRNGLVFNDADRVRFLKRASGDSFDYDYFLMVLDDRAWTDTELSAVVMSMIKMKDYSEDKLSDLVRKMTPLKQKIFNYNHKLLKKQVEFSLDFSKPETIQFQLESELEEARERHIHLNTHPEFERLLKDWLPGGDFHVNGEFTKESYETFRRANSCYNDQSLLQTAVKALYNSENQSLWTGYKNTIKHILAKGGIFAKADELVELCSTELIRLAEEAREFEDTITSDLIPDPVKVTSKTVQDLAEFLSSGDKLTNGSQIEVDAEMWKVVGYGDLLQGGLLTIQRKDESVDPTPRYLSYNPISKKVVDQETNQEFTGRSIQLIDANLKDYLQGGRVLYRGKEYKVKTSQSHETLNHIHLMTCSDEKNNEVRFEFNDISKQVKLSDQEVPDPNTIMLRKSAQVVFERPEGIFSKQAVLKWTKSDSPTHPYKMNGKAVKFEEANNSLEKLSIQLLLILDIIVHLRVYASGGLSLSEQSRLQLVRKEGGAANIPTIPKQLDNIIRTCCLLEEGNPMSDQIKAQIANV